MTKKRFGVITNWCVYENVDGVEKWLNFNEVVELLNELHDENQMLKEEYADDCNEANSLTVKIAELTEENEQLKKDCSILVQSNQEYRKENEQLKSVLKEMVRVSEYNGAISPMRVKSMTYHFIRDELND